MKTIAPHAFAIKLLGDCIVVGDCGVGAMKGSIEAGNLSHFGPAGHEHPDRRKIVWLVERCERTELLQLREHFFVDENRPVIAGAAMNDAMPDGD